MTTIIVFGSSLFIASALVVLQGLELRKSKKNIILSLIARLDPYSEKLLETLRFRLLQIIQTVRFIIFVWSREFLKSYSDRLRERIFREFEMRRRVVMGEKEIRNNGSVSFYLRKIKEEKTTVGKGKIEDELN